MPAKQSVATHADVAAVDGGEGEEGEEEWGKKRRKNSPLPPFAVTRQPERRVSADCTAQTG